MRIAVVDVGSYSVRMSVAEVGNGRVKILKEMGRITSLATSLNETGRIREDRIR